MPTKPVKVGRDSGTGKFIPVREAERRPSTTQVETIRRVPVPSVLSHQEEVAQVTRDSPAKISDG